MTYRPLDLSAFLPPCTDSAAQPANVAKPAKEVPDFSSFSGFSRAAPSLADRARADLVVVAGHDCNLARAEAGPPVAPACAPPSTVPLDHDGHPAGPCGCCGGPAFWRLSLTADAPWRCCTCDPRADMDALTDACFVLPTPEATP